LEIVAGVWRVMVGYAANLALAPEELVVVEGGHLVEVDALMRLCRLRRLPRARTTAPLGAK